MLLLTSVTWMHLAGSGPPRLLPLRKLKRCSLCGLGSRTAPEAGRMPSMQYGSLKPRTWWVPQSQPALGPQTRPTPEASVPAPPPPTPGPLTWLLPAHRWGLWPAGSWRARRRLSGRRWGPAVGAATVSGARCGPDTAGSAPLHPEPLPTSTARGGICPAGGSLTLALFTRSTAAACSSGLVPNTCGPAGVRPRCP